MRVSGVRAMGPATPRRGAARAGAGPLRLGLIGCGQIAMLGYLPALAAVPGLRLAAVADPSAERRRALVAAAGPAPSAHDGAEALIATGQLDAVVIASPTESHLAHARLAAAAGLACMVEKPPGPTLASAREVALLEPTPWIGFNRRFRPGRKLAEGLPATGPLELELELGYRRASWRAHESHDDALLDLGPHLIDLALWLGGGAGAWVLRAALAPERAELELETERGRALIRCATDRLHRERVVARSTAGRVEARSGGIVRACVARLGRRPHPLVGSLALQLAAFAAAARGGDPGALATAEDGVATMAMIDQARALAGGAGGRARAATVAGPEPATTLPARPTSAPRR